MEDLTGGAVDQADSAGEALAFLQAFSAQAAHLRGVVENVAGRVDALERRHAEACSNWTERLNRLAERAKAAGDALAAGVGSVCDASESAAAGIRTTAGDLAGAMQEAQDAVAALGTQAGAIAGAAGEQAQQLASELAAGLREQARVAGLLRDSAAAGAQRVAQDVGNACTAWIATHREDVAAFDAACAAGMARVLTDEVEQLQERLGASAATADDTLSNHVEAMSRGVADTMAALAGTQSEQVRQLRATAQRVSDAIDSAANALKTLSRDFSRSTGEVVRTMGETQVGLKVTVGSLQKIEQLFKQVQL